MSTLAEHLNITLRYRRSTNVQRDASDADFLAQLKITPTVLDVMERLGKGVQRKTTQRAWRLTGDYGTGKSTVALAFAAAAGGGQAAPREVTRRLEEWYPDRLKWTPLLLNGSREPLSRTILALLKEALAGRGSPWVRPAQARTPAEVSKVVGRIEEALGQRGESIRARRVVELLEEALPLIASRSQRQGVILVLDELGRFLEYAALHSEEDVGLLQLLAERAASDQGTPLYLLAVTHQAFDAYASQLADAMRREWLKVAGRFEEVVLDPPPEQVAVLVAEALSLEGVTASALPTAASNAAMQGVVNLGWFGAVRDSRALVALAPRLYPIHPSVLPVARALFARLGQNERSLLGFLASEEPCALSAWARGVSYDKKARLNRFFTLADFFDYVRANLSHKVASQRFRTSWAAAESIVDGLEASDDRAAAVVKTVALLDLVDHPAMTATTAALEIAMVTPADELKIVLDRLRAAVPPVLHDRGSGGYCVWPKTSVNLERRFREAERAVERPQHVLDLVRASLQPRPLVARRHSIETGTLRYFDVVYSSLESVRADGSWRANDSGGAGRVVVVLSESPTERAAVKEAVASIGDEPRVVFVVPPSLEGLRNDVWELGKWRWIEANTAGLEHDTYAAEEVSRQLRSVRDRIDAYIGATVLPAGAKSQGGEWYWRGKLVILSGRRSVLEHLSDVCDKVFAQAPRVNNELINRRQLSSAAAAARMRLIERLFSEPSSPLFGMNSEERSPEISLYMSIFGRGQLHRAVPLEGGGVVHRLGLSQEDPLHIRPAFDALRRRLQAAGTDKVGVPELIEVLRAPPYGVRDGLGYLLLAVFYSLEGSSLSIYERESFLPVLNSAAFERLLKTPSSFQWQLHQQTPQRDDLLRELEALAKEVAGPTKGVVEVVRALIMAVKLLPLYARRSRELSPTARAVLDTLAAARDPAKLLYDDLPKAVGLAGTQQTLLAGSGAQSLAIDVKPSEYAAKLREALAEVRGHYDALLERIRLEFLAAFELEKGSLESARAALSTRAAELLPHATSVEVRQFCAAIADPLPQREWLERVGLAVLGTPTDRWTDEEARSFRQKLRVLQHAFLESEAAYLAFGRVPKDGYLISVASPTGAKGMRLVQASALETAEVLDARDRIEALVKEAGPSGLAALVGALTRIVQTGATVASVGEKR